MKLRRYRFWIIPVKGKAFEIAKLAEDFQQAYGLVLRLYGRFALDILPIEKEASK